MYKSEHPFFDSDSIKRIAYNYYFIRQDKKNNLFHLNKYFDETENIGNVTRFDFSIPGKNQYTVSDRYEYDSVKLTEKENKIFIRWAQNARDTKLPILNTRE